MADPVAALKLLDAKLTAEIEQLKGNETIAAALSNSAHELPKISDGTDADSGLTYITESPYDFPGAFS